MTYEELTADKDLLKTIVLYHILPQEVEASDAMELTEWTLVPTV